MTITLYDCATAPSPRRARILLAEKGVAHETVQVDLRSGAQFDEAFRRVNPQCTVPALQTEEGALLTDNAAIASRPSNSIRQFQLAICAFSSGVRPSNAGSGRRASR
jgi:glutaredoxin